MYEPSAARSTAAARMSPSEKDLLHAASPEPGVQYATPSCSASETDSTDSDSGIAPPRKFATKNAPPLLLGNISAKSFSLLIWTVVSAEGLPVGAGVGSAFGARLVCVRVGRWGYEVAKW